MEEIPQETSLDFNSKSTQEVLMFEDQIRKLLPINEIIKIMGNDSFLIGGTVRDVILGKTPSDLDFMSRMPVESIKNNLEDLGFIEMDFKEDARFATGKYSFKKSLNVFNFILNGKEVQITCIGEKTISELINVADINLNCCAFDIHSLKILNPDFVPEIINKELKFMDAETAKDDPVKIINALKQISRIPDLKVSQETMGIIKQSIPIVIDFFAKNPHLHHKLKSLFGNINSGQVLNLFENFDTENIFDGIEMKKNKLKVSDNYHSVTVEELNPEIKNKISNLVASQFGKRFDPTKLFNNKTNSVTYEANSNGEILACFLMDGERIYSSSAINKEHFVNLIADMCKNNYNVWATISITSNLLIDLAQKGGMYVVEDYNLVEKIITMNYPEYKGKIIIETKNGHTVYFKKDSKDTPQVLVIS